MCFSSSSHSAFPIVNLAGEVNKLPIVVILISSVNIHYNEAFIASCIIEKLRQIFLDTSRIDFYLCSVNAEGGKKSYHPPQ